MEKRHEVIKEFKGIPYGDMDLLINVASGYDAIS